jgi:hypothetical protein
MVWLLWQKPVAQDLSVQVKERLIAQFTLDPVMVDKMRYSGKKGHYSGRPVKYIRIYDPVLINNGGSDPPGYDALSQESGSRGALLFDGRIEANDQLYLTDQRTPEARYLLS